MVQLSTFDSLDTNRYPIISHPSSHHLILVYHLKDLESNYEGFVMDGWQDSATKLKDFCQNPPFAISLSSMLMGVNYPTDYVAINPDYGTFLKSIYIGSQIN